MNEQLSQFGLDWTVERESLVASETNRPTQSFGLFRSDNNGWLGTVGKRYEVFQNDTMYDVIKSAADRVGVPISRGGCLSGGAKVYLQAELPDMVIGNSNVNRFITVTNTHDGTAAIGFGSSNTVIVCRNTFYRAYKEVEKFRHTATAEERIREAVKSLTSVMGYDEELMVDFHRMSDTKFDEDLASRLIAKIFNVKTGEKDTPAVKYNAIEKLVEDVQTDIGIHGNNLWAMFNGVTRYTNHSMRTKSSTDRLESLMYGRAEEINRMTFDEIMRYIDERSPIMVSMA